MNYFDIVLRCFEHDPQTPGASRRVHGACNWESRALAEMSVKVSESDFVGRRRKVLREVAVSSDSLNHLRSAVTVERCFAGRGDR